MPRIGDLVDRLTQLWVRATGRRVNFAECPWLAGPVGAAPVIGDEWLLREAGRLDADVRQGGGLLSTMAPLSGPGFDPQLLAPEIVEFYERTSQWRLDVWSQWCPMAWPIGWVLSATFARRLEQLSLPMRPLDASYGMDSQVRSVIGHDGSQLGAAWIRRLRSTGQTVYSGWYGTVLLPGAPRRSVRVVFPLPNGSLSVFLRPENDAAGALRLLSPLGQFGENGAYLIVASHDKKTGWVRRIPISEEFRLHVDEEGILRTDHALDLWRIPVIRLHYRIERGRNAEGDLPSGRRSSSPHRQAEQDQAGDGQTDG